MNLTVPLSAARWTDFPRVFSPILKISSLSFHAGVRGKASKAPHGVKRTLLKFFRVFSAADLREPLTAVFRNSDAKPADYCGTAARPSHADYAANRKYGGYNDPRGGGAFSGRLTAPLVFAGAIAKQLLREHGIRVFSHVLRIGNISDLRFEPCMCEQPILDPFFPLVAPNRRSAFEELFEKAAAGKTSLGGIVECAALLEPESAFFGEPFFDGVESMISHIVFSIPGIHGIEFGAGFGFADLDGASANDRILSGGKTKTNNSGGINGGIANGMPIVFRACFRPVPTVMREQLSIDFVTGEETVLAPRGRHDVCILPRGCAAVEAAAAIALLDLVFRQ